MGRREAGDGADQHHSLDTQVQHGDPLDHQDEERRHVPAPVASDGLCRDRQRSW